MRPGNFDRYVKANIPEDLNQKHSTFWLNPIAEAH